LLRRGFQRRFLFGGILGMAPRSWIDSRMRSATLEKRLGITLIQRTTRKLNITQAGDAYFKHCVRALEEMSAGEKEISTTRTEPEGLLRITAPPDLGHSLLPAIVRNYLKTYPKTQIELLLTDRFVDLVGEGVDLAIRVGPLKDSSLIARKFRDGEVFFWASSSYIAKRGSPRNPKDLTEHAFISHKAYGSTIKCVNGRQVLLAKIEPRIIVDDFEAMKLFIIAGDGIGALTPVICETEVTKAKMTRVLPGWSLQLGGSQKSIYFVYPPQRYVSRKTHAFIELALRNE
jgi:DNA-binding transcriptional LysR family regulator